MKNIFALVIAALSMNTFATIPVATPINVPYPTQQERFTGTIRNVEVKLKNDLLEKAIQVCGTKENVAAISNVEVKVSFDVILIEKPLFEGMYPLGSVSALVECFNEGV